MVTYDVVIYVWKRYFIWILFCWPWMTLTLKIWRFSVFTNSIRKFSRSFLRNTKVNQMEQNWAQKFAQVLKFFGQGCYHATFCFLLWLLLLFLPWSRSFSSRQYMYFDLQGMTLRWPLKNKGQIMLPGSSPLQWYIISQ